MSSLLQFDGDIRKNPKTQLKEVGLEFVRYVLVTGKPISQNFLDPFVTCTICGKKHPQIGVAYRRPRGMLGCWVRFQYLGELHAPDLSVPIDVPEWPAGTHILSSEENSKNWHRGDNHQ